MAQAPSAGVISKSLKFKNAQVQLSTKDRPAIVIKGDGIVVNFNGATVLGTREGTDPDLRKGTAIEVHGKNVTIKNAKIHGYKLALLARNSPGLKIIDCDFSDNWKPRLLSTPEREDESDWLDYHNNDKDEWLRYGGGIYLTHCDGFEIKGVRIHGGQDGIKISNCNKGRIWNCDCSFLSGIGVGLYRSSDNKVMHNRLDYCVRGYSDGVYNRGQDSAAILVYEQSNLNIFAYNSATHSGDGFFLWAGQTTMDTGQGGCNDNIIADNDFSYAVTNGIEATFSRNSFYNNRVVGCWHGVWGGYSFDSDFSTNDFTGNEIGIAIEHGQRNRIFANTFEGNKTAISLWQNKTQDPNWGYPKNRDTVSHDNVIAANRFRPGGPAISLRDTKGTSVKGNTYERGMKFMVLSGNTAGTNQFDNGLKKEYVDPAEQIKMDGILIGYPGVRPLKGGMNTQSKWAWAPRNAIIVDEWGPYDYQTPKLWPEGPAKNGIAKFKVLGPRGTWRLKSVTGGATGATHGAIPGEISVTLGKAKAVDLNLRLNGSIGNNKRAIPFGISQFFCPIDWHIKWFKYDPATDLTKPGAFEQLITTKPLKQTQTDKLDYAGYDFKLGLPKDHFAAIAESDIDLPQGRYTLDAVTDDGMRVTIDGRRVIDSWKYQGPTPYGARITAGKHHLRVEYFQIDGYARMAVSIKKH